MIRLQKVCKYYQSGNRIHHALQQIYLEISQGETLGVVGESGSGKSTLGKLILGLEQPTAGHVYYNDKDQSHLTRQERLKLCREVQVVFQDPYASMNPRMTIEEIVGEGMRIHKLAYGIAYRDKIASLLHDVGLDSSMMARYPYQFSGGQRQRICIARALAVDPLFLVCDEALASLDVQTQRQIMALFKRLKVEKQLTYVFISHDLHAVRTIADNVAVMYQGEVVEYAPAAQIFTEPKHVYTQALLAAVIPNVIQKLV